MRGDQYSNVGGLVGVAFYSEIKNSYAVGRVLGGSSSYLGGFIGCDWSSNTVSYAYYNSENAVGVGDGSAETTGMTLEAMKQQEFADLLNSNVSALNAEGLKLWVIETQPQSL